MVEKEFLLGETREGFYVPEQVKQAWAAELEVLWAIDKACKENGIQYFAAWGTLLGAIRHGGFIPWDDDLDIMMKREDYTRFLQLAPTILPEGFHVQTFANQPDNWVFMGKVVGRNRICFEPNHLRKFHGFPYIACVDIFVLDYVHMDPEKEEQRRQDLKLIMGVADGIVEGRYTGAKKEEMLRLIEKKQGIKIKRHVDARTMGVELYTLMQERMGEVKESESEIITQLFPRGLKNDRFHMPKEYFDDAIYIPYENGMIPVPLAFEYYTEKSYREFWNVYMKGGGHDYPYFEGQKRNLYKIPGFEMPEYRFDPKKLRVPKTFSEMDEQQAKPKEYYKTLIEEGLLGLHKLFESIEVNLQESQQLAIDLGTLIEQVKGEGTGSVSILETYCEHLFLLFEAVSKGQDKEISAIREQMENMLQKLDVTMQKEILDSRCVVFFPVMAKDWESMSPEYERELKTENTDVYVVPIPYFFKDYDGSAREVCYEGDTLAQMVPIRDYRTFPLELMAPEKIYVQMAYDQWNPIYSVSADYYTDKLRSVTEVLIYIPPMEQDDFESDSERTIGNMRYYVPIPGAVEADRILVKSSELRKRYIECLTSFSGDEYHDVWEEKVVTRERYLEEITEVRTRVDSEDRNSGNDSTAPSKERKVDVLVVSTVGRILEKDIDPLEKLKQVFDYFESQGSRVDYRWALYPQDGMEQLERLIKRGKADASRVEHWRQMMERYSDHLITVKEAETWIFEKSEHIKAYYGDVSPLLRQGVRNHLVGMIANYSEQI